MNGQELSGLDPWPSDDAKSQAIGGRRLCRRFTNQFAQLLATPPITDGSEAQVASRVVQLAEVLGPLVDEEELTPAVVPHKALTFRTLEDFEDNTDGLLRLVLPLEDECASTAEAMRAKLPLLASAYNSHHALPIPPAASWKPSDEMSVSLRWSMEKKMNEEEMMKM